MHQGINSINSSPINSFGKAVTINTSPPPNQYSMNLNLPPNTSPITHPSKFKLLLNESTPASPSPYYSAAKSLMENLLISPNLSNPSNSEYKSPVPDYDNHHCLEENDSPNLI